MGRSKDPLAKKGGRPRTRHIVKDHPGRPSKLTPELSQKFCDALRLGMTLKMAAALVRVNTETVERWLNQGLAGNDEVHENFALDVEQAKVEFIKWHLENIRSAAKGTDGKPSWLPSAWTLERCQQETFAIQKTKLEVADVSVRDAAIRQAEFIAIQDRIDNCPSDHPRLQVEYKPATDHPETDETE